MLNMVQSEPHIYHVQAEFEQDGRTYKPGFYHANECDSVEGPFVNITIAKLAMDAYFKKLER